MRHVRRSRPDRAFRVGNVRCQRGFTGNRAILLSAQEGIRIVGGNVTAWRERRGHRLSPDMITGVFGVGVETLIIGTGADGLIEYSEEVAASIRLRGISCIIGAPTPESCRIYNEMHRSGSGWRYWRTVRVEGNCVDSIADVMLYPCTVGGSFRRANSDYAPIRLLIMPSENQNNRNRETPFLLVL